MCVKAIYGFFSYVSLLVGSLFMFGPTLNSFYFFRIIYYVNNFYNTQIYNNTLVSFIYMCVLLHVLLFVLNMIYVCVYWRDFIFVALYKLQDTVTYIDSLDLRADTGMYVCMSIWPMCGFMFF